LGNLIFLVGAIGLSIVGSVLLWLRYRQPTSFMSSIDDFQAEMTALSAERPAPGMAPGSSRLQPPPSLESHGVRLSGRARPSGVVARATTPRESSTGRPIGLTAPVPAKARQGSTVRRTAPPAPNGSARDVNGTPSS